MIKNKKKGAIIIEAVMAIIILIPIVLSLIVGAFSYYTALSEATDLNFEIGRYVAQYGCSYEEVNSLVEDTSLFDQFQVNIKGSKDESWATIQEACGKMVTGEGESTCIPKGSINITCKKNNDINCGTKPEDITSPEYTVWMNCMKKDYTSSKHTEFYVDVEIDTKQNVFVKLFPDVARRGSYYLQEVNGKRVHADE